MKDQQGFRVPDGYFEELPGLIQSQIQQLPDFEKSAVVNPFSVPEGYFEQLPLAISNAIEEKKIRFSVCALSSRFFYDQG
ncbi:MAG: hypothetical protein IPP86_00315 [Bacteroidetes bacterium]|nr:hypothetical protein [Bacteroidota bacterium]